MVSRIASALTCAVTLLYPALTHTREETQFLPDPFDTEDFYLDMFEKTESPPLVSIQDPSDEEESDEEDTPLEIEHETGFSSSVTETPYYVVSLGGNWAYSHLKVKGKPSFYGHLEGIQATYEYRPPSSFSTRFHALYRQGKLKSTTARRILTETDLSEVLSYTISCDERVGEWSFFAGLGYHHLEHQLTDHNCSTIYFRYNEFYLPIGLFTDYHLTSWFSWGMRATWMPQIYPTVTIIPIEGARWQIAGTCGNIRTQLPLTFVVGKQRPWTITLEPTFTYWKDGQTTAKTTTGQGLNLPSNASYFWGCDLTLRYPF